MNVNYRDIPDYVWEYIDNVVIGKKPDPCAEAGYKSKARFRAEVMGLVEWGPVAGVEQMCLTPQGVDACFWRQEQTGKPAVKAKRKPGRKSNAARDGKIAREYRDGLNNREWVGQADYLRNRHPKRVREGERAARAWLSALLKRVEGRQKNRGD